MASFESDRICCMPGCDQPILARKLCRKHYVENRRKTCVKQRILCRVSGCSEAAYSKGYCRKHYTQVWRRGEVRHEPRPERMWANGEEAYQRLRVLSREFSKVETMYNLAIGFENRLRWRRELTAIRAEIVRIESVMDRPGLALAQI